MKKLRVSFLPIVVLIEIGVALSGCATTPRVIPVPTSPGAVRPAPEQITDYPKALAAIVSVLTEEFKVPVPRVDLYLFPSRYALEKALLKEMPNDQTRAREIAGSALGAAGRDKIFGVEPVLERYRWQFRILLLTHELTHTVQFALADGRGTSDQWLREGFADWTASRVLESLGFDTYAQIRGDYLLHIRSARDYQPFPSLWQLVSSRGWHNVALKHGSAMTYGQSFFAVEFLIQRHGVQAVIEYFHLFARSQDRIGNFRVTFGQPFYLFELEFATYLQDLLK